MIDTVDGHRNPARSWGATLLLGAALGLPLSLTAGMATADEEPLELTDQITDTVGALAGSEDEVEASLADLRDETGLQLFVVYVDRFDRADGASWAEETYDLNGFGEDDLLLAVAVDQRAYGTASTARVIDSGGLTSWRSEFIEPHLADDDWAGAAIGAADGLAELLPDGVNTPVNTDQPPPNSGESWQPSGSSGFSSFPWIFAVPVMAVVGSKVISAVGNKSARRSRDAAGELPTESSRTAQVPTQELQRHAAASLVGLDNALRSAEEELSFAEAQFGQQRTQAFREVLKDSRTRSQEAFRIRQQLDDADQEAESVERHMLGQIIELCTAAKANLDSHTAQFAEMRALQDNVPQFLEELAGRAGEVAERLPVADQEINGLAARYPEQALVTVRAHRAQAERLIDSAHGFVDAGREALTTSDRPSAVAAARAAEESIGQAVRLLDAIASADSDLANAKQVLSKAVASLTSDIQDAQRLAPKDSVIQPVVERARQAIARGQSADTSGDPLAALALLDATEHDLDTLLDPLRDAESQRTKIREDFGERVSRVGARLRSIDETIATRRGAVNSGARTRISEALRLFEDAQRLADTDATKAVSLLTRAEQLGEQALSEAQQDLDRWNGPGSSNRSGGIDPLSLILGGILAGGNRHSGGWGGGGGFGGGGFGGGGGGGFGGGGFGGGGTASSGGRF
ncbi:TPM domain-containing protein [Ornithinimicrobium cryptoxanthini]|uniref:TPM domain-containing protein n=1 Tax=Ornithinimicrobium cryptoxanthini TaxID=2934161 RepID=A0ABY4YG94_9MICO|nr:TPM domain-containing protein [Ornithinimicrobium cryptoxanthini]USQ75793.1 TPM domain-containing protein [Ornithinimicrobium cryptoxanthini]